MDIGSVGLGQTTWLDFFGLDNTDNQRSGRYCTTLPSPKALLK